MSELVERINKVRVESEKVSKKDKEAVSALYSENLNDDLTNYIIQSKIERNKKFK
ncbi:hypothetical protein ACRRVB_03420 [Candidatus Cardinium hertigii]|uniref:hypothetical protein n=1 Tax=Candidatus Cardinium hertigii TaxID=247481 RepID=UPI003D7D635D